MNRISQFFKKLIGKPEQPKPMIEHFTIPASKPKEKTFSLFSRLRFKKRAHARMIAQNPVKRVGFGTFSRLKPIGGHPVRHLSREFKEAFLKEYGWRLK